MGDIQGIKDKEQNLLSMWMVAYDERTKLIAEKSADYVWWVDRTSQYFENFQILKWAASGGYIHERPMYSCLLSPKFFNKAARGRATRQFIEEALRKPVSVRVSRTDYEERPCEVLTFGNGYKPKVSPILQGDNFHGEGFSQLTQEIFNQAGINWDVKRPASYPVFSNYWIATPGVIREYVFTFLQPCMEVMSNDPSISERLWKNSKYPHKLPAQAVQDIGVNYYPLHTFVCERFFSVFLDIESQKRQITVKSF